MSNFCFFLTRWTTGWFMTLLLSTSTSKSSSMEQSYSSSSWRGCNWNNSLNHQRRQFILPDSTRSGWNHLCFPRQPIVLGCTTVLHTLHQVEFTMRFSKGSLCHKLRRRRRLGGKTGGGEEAGCGGGGVEHYGRFLLCFPSITHLSYKREAWDRTWAV